MQLYRLTDQECRTRRGRLLFGPNVTQEVIGPLVPALRGLHAYPHPLLAVFLDPAHAGYGENALCWELDDDCGEVIVQWDKVVCRKQTTLRTIPLPTITPTQRVSIARRCAMHAHQAVQEMHRLTNLRCPDADQCAGALPTILPPGSKAWQTKTQEEYAFRLAHEFDTTASISAFQSGGYLHFGEGEEWKAKSARRAVEAAEMTATVLRLTGRGTRDFGDWLLRTIEDIVGEVEER